MRIRVHKETRKVKRKSGRPKIKYKGNTAYQGINHYRNDNKGEVEVQAEVPMQINATINSIYNDDTDTHTHTHFSGV